jgi:hypothetical protein
MTDGAVERQGESSWVDHAAAAAAWEREHAAEWTRVDGKLRGIAGRRAALDAEEARLLRYAEEIKLWGSSIADAAPTWARGPRRLEVR